MAIDRVNKVLIAVHRDRRESFLRSLQQQGILHITRTEEPSAEQMQQAGESRRVVEAVEFLSSKAKQKSGRPTLTRAEFDSLAASYDYRSRIERLERLNREAGELGARLKAIEVESNRLRPWEKLVHAPGELYSLLSAAVTLGRFHDTQAFAAAAEALQERQCAIELVALVDGEAMALVACLPGAHQDVSSVLGELRFEAVDLHGVHGRPADVLAQLAREAEDVRRREQTLTDEIQALTRELPRLKATADALANNESRDAAAAALEQTDSVSLIHGWAKVRDATKLEKLVAHTGFAAMAGVEPAEGEEPPVALVNRRVFRPFELVLELFSLPSPREFDPTWLVAPFFGVFFALCLTDAGYGLVVAALAYLLLRKMGMGNKLLGIVLIGGILTIPAGALVGGWFGDMPDRLGIHGLLSFKNAVMWFDPVKDPMKFFILSIALGYTQMMAGIAFEIADCVRAKSYGDGLLVQLPWFVSLNALVARVLFAKSLPVWGSAMLMILVLVSVAAIVVFTQRSRKTALSQTLWFAFAASFFVFLGARLRWLPSGFMAARWAVLAVFIIMYVQATNSLVRGRIRRPVPIVLGVLAAAALALYLVHVLPAAVAGILGVVFFLSTPANHSVLTKFLWGGYALYGATGYIGVVLSYIRLMALGMCTGGVAVAVNVVAWMVLKMPVVGIPLALVVLLVGHSYNIAVNVLGAFVHSLRLQYVEFFPRFYAGGGERFNPLREQNQFVTVR